MWWYDRNPPREETTAQWRARVIDAYNRRNDPEPEPELEPQARATLDSLRVIERLFYIDFDVSGDPERKSFYTWFNARDDILLWRSWCTHRFEPTESQSYGAERAMPAGTRFKAASWTELRQLIEAFDKDRGAAQ